MRKAEKPRVALMSGGVTEGGGGRVTGVALGVWRGVVAEQAGQ